MSRCLASHSRDSKGLSGKTFAGSVGLCCVEWGEAVKRKFHTINLCHFVSQRHIIRAAERKDWRLYKGETWAAEAGNDEFEDGTWRSTPVAWKGTSKTYTLHIHYPWSLQIKVMFLVPSSTVLDSPISSTSCVIFASRVPNLVLTAPQEQEPLTYKAVDTQPPRTPKKMPLRCQFLLTLMKPRQHLNHKDFARRVSAL